MRVLLLADSCNPDWASLPAVGYNACRAIADYAHVTLATHVRNRDALEKSGCGNAEIVYLNNEYIASPLYRISNFLRGGKAVSWTTAMAMAYPSYLAFEWEVWKHFKKQLKEGKFDIVHRVTPMSPTQVSPLAKWSQTPFVLGPLNGGLKWPAGFRGELNREREWMTYLRNVYKILPYHASTYKNATAILAGFNHTIDDLPANLEKKIIDFPEVGIDPELFHSTHNREPNECVTFVFVGRLVPYKCPDVVVEAFVKSDVLRNHRLVIVGEGPERPRLEGVVKEAGRESSVVFTGWKTQTEVGDLMRKADVFVFPSIRELGAGVVVEAMACGLAPVVVDYGAPGPLVGDCGIRIPLGYKDELITGYINALEALVNDPERRINYGKMAYKRALDHFSWDVKARKTLEVYKWILGERNIKPVFESAPES